MAKTNELCDHVMDLLAPLGTPRYRAMFGGYGIYLDERMVAIVAGNVLIDGSPYQDVVIESLIMLAGQPEVDEFGHPRVRSARNDPAGLRLVADRQPSAVRAEIRKFLRRRESPSDLNSKSNEKRRLQKSEPGSPWANQRSTPLRMGRDSRSFASWI